MFYEIPLFIPPLLGSGSNTWFLRPTRAHKTNGISIGSSVLAQLMVVTKRHTQTLRPRYICSNMPHLALILRFDLITVMVDIYTGKLFITINGVYTRPCAKNLLKSSENHLLRNGKIRIKMRLTVKIHERNMTHKFQGPFSDSKICYAQTIAV